MIKRLCNSVQTIFMEPMEPTLKSEMSSIERPEAVSKQIGFRLSISSYFCQLMKMGNIY